MCDAELGSIGIDHVESGELLDSDTLSLEVRQPLTLHQQLDLPQLEGILQRTREMIRYVDSARDAALLVRRSNVTEKLIDEALKTCRLLHEEQFKLKQDAAETHLRTQRRAGELLAEVKKHRGGRPPLAVCRGPAEPRPPTLEELGIDAHDSHRWQLIASLPAERFEEYIVNSRAVGHELTTAALLTIANRLRKLRTERERTTAVGAREATLVEYEKSRPFLWSTVWLDPAVIAAAMDRTQQRDELAGLNRLRVWLDEFERVLSSPGARAVPAS